ncbi:MAG TPA: M20/M25/M40 family metallo-hydrolase [Baekduia sp.]|uniref:M20/M25/M40 family metallo-hydrolase n=1 Tax=Baekduia sp. TaxID=2600305 RepID=UPI002B64E9B6|nr:M20/M25/M40 family metallo-hydrolase [Baekduia sp.]HMJ36356.1 M20/M25/M40 family metallo-hydrolase [Baekduia sp.]
MGHADDVMTDRLLGDLVQWLRIPSISTGEPDRAGLHAAATWASARVREAGGTADVLDGYGHPLVVGELRAGHADAPTVLIYGHYDVQAPGDLGAWQTPPFEPAVRDGRLYARGASDDKGNFLPLLHAACELHRAGALPVHVRVLVEGEEEIGSTGAARWLRDDRRGADCAIVFDAGMADEATPALTVSLRGVVRLQVAVRSAARDLHSGIYGGSVVNALHVLHAMLATVLPGPDGTLREELRAGIEPPHPAEPASWARLAPGDALLTASGGRPLHPGAGAEYYPRNGAGASLDVHAIAGGDTRTIVPAVATATLSQRLAPGQRPTEIAATLERLLRAAAPAGVEVEIDAETADPIRFAPDEPAIRLAAGAIERATGIAPAFVRLGATIPIVAELAAQGMPVIVSGFAVHADAMHAPNESFRLESLRLGEATARELLSSLAALGAPH